MKKFMALFLIVLLSSSISGCAVTGGTLIKASYEGQTTVIKDLLDKGVDVNERGGCGLWSAGGDFGATPLLCAALGGHMEAVKMLIDRGADVNAKGNGAGSIGQTPLTAAACGGHASIVKLLIEKGADIDGAMAMLSKHRGNNNLKEAYNFLEKIVAKKQATKNPEYTASREIIPVIKSDIDELPAIKTKPNKNAYAIVIGIEQYRQKLPKADFAVQDANTMTQYLTKVMGYPEENVITLLNDRATNVDLAKYFEKWLPNNVENGSSVFIYFSGHGAPNPKTGDAYLVPYDGDPNYLPVTGYPLKRLYASLGKLEAKEIIIVLDSCFSGAGGRSVIAKGARPLVMNLQSSVALSKNITVLAASSGDQISSTYDEKGHGLFTYFMLKGIKNEDVVKPDGSIAISDLFTYLKPQVQRIARKQYNNEQTPQLIAPKK